MMYRKKEVSLSCFPNETPTTLPRGELASFNIRIDCDELHFKQLKKKLIEVANAQPFDCVIIDENDDMAKWLLDLDRFGAEATPGERRYMLSICPDLSHPMARYLVNTCAWDGITPFNIFEAPEVPPIIAEQAAALRMQQHPRPGYRSCVRCDAAGIEREFWSNHPGDRICPSCRRKN